LGNGGAHAAEPVRGLAACFHEHHHDGHFDEHASRGRKRSPEESPNIITAAAPATSKWSEAPITAEIFTMIGYIMKKMQTAMGMETTGTPPT